MKSILSFLLVVVLSSVTVGLGALPQQEADRVVRLPGQPPVDFKQYAGYVTVNEEEGRELFYVFAESSSDKSGSKPLVLWLNGGPGCSSLAYGFGEEIGPYRIHPNGTGLYLNPYAWNKEVNVIWLESPTGVGFSFAKYNMSANEQGGDKRTAGDSYSFMIGWLKRFPQYQTRNFYLAGESYAGHYIPQLAKVIVDRNTKASLKINLKGFMVGNPVFDNYWDNVGDLDYYYQHAMMSKETYDSLKKNCDFQDRNCCSDLCNELYNNASVLEFGQIDPYSIYTPSCVGTGTRRAQSPLQTRNPFLQKRVAGYDPCSGYYAEIYFNRPDVQKALHANVTGEIPYPWTSCSNEIANWTDAAWSMIPTYRDLIQEGLKIWVYSGDADSVVPATATRYAIASMNLPIVTPWHAWYHHEQVGGRVEKYKGITYVTIRGAGHEVPLLQRSRFLHMIRAFVADKPLPPAPYV